jgi:DNA processing protein
MRSLLQHDWARGYAQRPGVSVVDNADDVFEGLQRLAAESAGSTELVWA